MTLPSILIIAVGLGMDAFSVAIGIGAVIRTASYGPAFRLSFHFGLLDPDAHSRLVCRHDGCSCH